MSSSYRLTIRLGPKDAELAAALQSYPPGRRSVIVRTVLRAWLCGPEALKRALEAAPSQQPLPDSVSMAGAETPDSDLVNSFLSDFLGAP